MALRLAKAIGRSPESWLSMHWSGPSCGVRIGGLARRAGRALLGCAAGTCAKGFGAAAPFNRRTDGTYLMQIEDPREVWADYYQRKKSQRMQEAAALSAEMSAAGVTSDTVMALDFVHFGSVKEAVEALAAQLSESYAMQVVADANEGYWLASGTTRPHGITLTEEQHLGWVDFMCDVAQSHACVFSRWSLDAVSLGRKFESERIASAS